MTHLRRRARRPASPLCVPVLRRWLNGLRASAHALMPPVLARVDADERTRATRLIVTSTFLFIAAGGSQFGLECGAFMFWGDGPGPPSMGLEGGRHGASELDPGRPEGEYDGRRRGRGRCGLGPAVSGCPAAGRRA